jgi:hypothetical protein
MRRALVNLVERVVGLLPAVRPVFEVGKDQKLTIVMEPVAPEIGRVNETPDQRAQAVRVAVLLEAIDAYAYATAHGTGEERLTTFNALLVRRDAFR